MQRRTLTTEGIAWLAVLLIALALRLTGLEAAPLSTPEAGEALAAWQASSLRAVSDSSSGTSDSPMLLSATALVFTLFGASDGSARLLPALAGSFVVLTPWLLRKRIGRIGSLAAGVLLAISPTMLVASRQADGSILAALGCMLGLGALTHLSDGHDGRWTPLSAVGLALCMTSSPVAYSLLVPAAAALAALPGAIAIADARVLWRAARPGIANTAIVLFASLAIFSTGLGWRPSGLAETAGLAARWVSGFGIGAGTAPQAVSVVAAYEFLLIALATGGVLWAIRRQHCFGTFLSIWAGLALAAASLRSTGRPLDAITIAMPAALLGGISLEALLRRLWQPDIRTALSILAPTCLGICIYITLLCAHYAKQGRPESVVLVLLGLGLLGLLVVAVAFVMQAPGAFPSLAVGGTAALLLATIAVGWGVTHTRSADPRELALYQPTDPSVRRLVDTLTEMSWKETGAPRRLAFSYEGGTRTMSANYLVLAWYLRDFRYARPVEPGAELPSLETSHVHVSASAAGGRRPSDSVGQDFPLRRTWNQRTLACTWRDVPDCDGTATSILSHPQTTNGQACAWYERLNCTTALNWILFRSAPSLLDAQDSDVAILWLRQAEQESAD